VTLLTSPSARYCSLFKVCGCSMLLKRRVARKIGSGLGEGSLRILSQCALLPACLMCCLSFRLSFCFILFYLFFCDRSYRRVGCIPSSFGGSAFSSRFGNCRFLVRVYFILLSPSKTFRVAITFMPRLFSFTSSKFIIHYSQCFSTLNTR